MLQFTNVSSVCVFPIRHEISMKTHWGRVKWDRNNNLKKKIQGHYWGKLGINFKYNIISVYSLKMSLIYLLLEYTGGPLQNWVFHAFIFYLFDPSQQPGGNDSSCSLLFWVIAITFTIEKLSRKQLITVHSWKMSASQTSIVPKLTPRTEN